MQQPPYPPAPQYPPQQYPQQPYPPHDQQPYPPPQYPQAPSDDPWKVPLRLVMAGLSLGLLATLLTSAIEGEYYLFRLQHLALMLLVLAGQALVLAGAVSIAQKRQAGHALALVAAAAYGAAVLFTLLRIAGVAPDPREAGPEFSPLTFVIVGLLRTLTHAAALAALALSLQQLGKARGRPLDAIALGVLGAEAFVIFSAMVFGYPFGGLLPRFVGGLNLYVAIPGLALILSLGARMLLVVATQGVAEGPVPPGGLRGSFVLGFLAGFFGGCIGAGLVFAIAKGAQTKRGAGAGFAWQVVAGILLRAHGR
jgi:hypothetical protein